MKTKLTLFVAVIAVALFGTGCSSLDKGLVAYYPFDGNASDMSGNGNHGTVNGATLGADRQGVAGNAYDFDGNDWIDLGNILSQYNLITISAWFNPVGNSSDNGIVSKPRHASGTGAVLRVGAAGFNNDPINLDLNANTQVDDGSWHHGVLVNNGLKLSLYLGGLLVDEENYTSQAVTSSERIFIGKEFGARFYRGSIDDVRIYNRALSAEEIKTLYDLEKPKTK